MTTAKPGTLCQQGEDLPETVQNLIDALDGLREQVAIPVPTTEDAWETEQRQKWVARIDAAIGKIEQHLALPHCRADAELMRTDEGLLHELLEEFTPPYCFLCCRNGEVSFHLDHTALDGAAHDGDLLRVADTSEVPDDYVGEVLHVNDHGNTTLYFRGMPSGELEEFWAVV